MADRALTIPYSDDLLLSLKERSAASRNKPLAKLTHDAVAALFQMIGIAETVRFLHQFSLGAGDYTRERRKFLGEPSLEEIVSEIRERRARKGLDPGSGV